MSDMTRQDGRPPGSSSASTMPVTSRPGGAHGSKPALRSAAAVPPEAAPLVLESSDEAPARARRYLTERFRELGHTDDFIGRLVVTELVTNSYKHVGIGLIVVRISPDAREPLTVIEVWDESSALPVVQDKSDDAESGRGLLLMAQLVHDWGIRPLNEGGKITWARCAR